MGNREFLDAVLEAMHRGGRWSARDIAATRSEAVRRRFARWAHLGVFEGLAAALKGLPLSAEHRLLLALACHRAQTLKRCTGR